MFSDSARKAVSLIGLASICDLKRITRSAIDPRRFRANLYFELARTWQELDWVGHEITAGATRLRVVDRIKRCAAMNVDPDTAVRDLNIPRALQVGFQHADMGVYAEGIGGGAIAPGDPLTRVDA